MNGCQLSITCLAAAALSTSSALASTIDYEQPTYQAGHVIQGTDSGDGSTNFLKIVDTSAFASTTFDTGDQSLEFFNGSATASAGHYGLPITASGSNKAHIAFDMYVPADGFTNNSNQFALQLYGKAGTATTQAYRVRFGGNAPNLNIQDAKYVTGSRIDTNKWLHFDLTKISVAGSNDSLHLTISDKDGVIYDGNRTLTNGDFLADVDSLTELRFTDYTQNTNGYFYVDNVKIEVVPEPGSLGLLTLGGLMMLRRRRN